MRVLSECGCRTGAGAKVQLACGRQGVGRSLRAGARAWAAACVRCRGVARLSCGDNVWLLADDQPQGFLDYYT